MRSWVTLLTCMLALTIFAICVQTGEGSQSKIVMQNHKLRLQLKKERAMYKHQIKELRKIAEPILQPTPEGNRILARLFFKEDYNCAAIIINGETGSTWRHDIGYGAKYGEYLINSGRPYGLGQALPGTKMLAYGSDAASNPLTQMKWFKAYADGRYGSVCAAANYWQSHRHW